MNTESAALCCGNRPSTHRSGRPVLVCRSCGDQLQGDTEAATISAWNRAKSPATLALQAALAREEKSRADGLQAEVAALKAEIADHEQHWDEMHSSEAYEKRLQWHREHYQGAYPEGVAHLDDVWDNRNHWKAIAEERAAEIKALRPPGGPLKPLGEMLKAVPSEVEQLRADLDTALEYVEDAVNQACQITEKTGEVVLDTMCNGAWESACDYLHRLGRVTEILPGRIYAFPWMVEKNAKVKEANHG